MGSIPVIATLPFVSLLVPGEIRNWKYHGKKDTFLVLELVSEQVMGVLLWLKVENCCKIRLWALLVAHVENCVLQDGHCGQAARSAEVPAEGRTSVFGLSSSSLLKDALKAAVSRLSLVPQAVSSLLPCVTWLQMCSVALVKETKGSIIQCFSATLQKHLLGWSLSVLRSLSFTTPHFMELCANSAAFFPCFQASRDMSLFYILIYTCYILV